MRGHNICFHWEIRKIIFELSSIPLSPGALPSQRAIHTIFILLSWKSFLSTKMTPNIKLKRNSDIPSYKTHFLSQKLSQKYRSLVQDRSRIMWIVLERNSPSYKINTVIQALKILIRHDRHCLHRHFCPNSFDGMVKTFFLYVHLTKKQWLVFNIFLNDYTGLHCWWKSYLIRDAPFVYINKIIEVHKK